MAKKAVTPDSYGPYYDTYIKFDHEGSEYEQEVPVYREISTQYGTFGVPKGHKMTFKENEKGVEPVYTKTSAKAKKPKKVAEAKPEVVSTEE